VRAPKCQSKRERTGSQEMGEKCANVEGKTQITGTVLGMGGVLRRGKEKVEEIWSSETRGRENSEQ